MNPNPSTNPFRSQQAHRFRVTAVATLAGVGAALTLFAMSPSTASSGMAIAPVAAAPASSDTTAPAATRQAAAPAAAPQSTSAPAQSPAPAPSHPMPAPSGDSCEGLRVSVAAFMQHAYAAHMEASPAQQATDALSADQYTKTHTVLAENMIKPMAGGGDAALNTFLQHVYAAHLEASPSQQAADALSIDQYIKTHTVLVENMVKPLVGTDLSSC